MATKRKKISVEDKMEVIKCFERGENNSEISQKFNLSSSTVSTILKNHKAIRDAFENNQKSAKRLRKAEKADLDDALCKWLRRYKQSNGFLTRKILMQQASKLAAELGYKNFACSHSWLDRFKNRHKVEYQNVSTSRINPEWLENSWPDIKSGYFENDIFVLDETDLLYKTTTDKHSENEKKSVGENSTIHRSTIFVCTNMTGTEKRKLIVVENKKCDEIFGDLPVVYYPNKKSASAVDILKTEICYWDQTAERKILLLVGKPGHDLKTKLNNIETVLVPCDHVCILYEVVMNYHNHFRDLLLDYQINRRKTKPRTGYQLSCMEALNLLKDAWDKVKPETVVNCLGMAGLTSVSFDSTPTFIQKEMQDDNYVSGFEMPVSSAECSMGGEDPLSCSSNFHDTFWEETKGDGAEHQFLLGESDEMDIKNFGAGTNRIKIEVECDVVKAELESSEVSEEGGTSFDEGPLVEKEVKTEPQWDETNEDEVNVNVSLPEAQDAIKTLESFYKNNTGVNATFEIYLEKLKLAMNRYSENV